LTIYDNYDVNVILVSTNPVLRKKIAENRYCILKTINTKKFHIFVQSFSDVLVFILIFLIYFSEQLFVFLGILFCLMFIHPSNHPIASSIIVTSD